jgi:F-type H+-transporting ATPase subunit epsilon
VAKSFRCKLITPEAQVLDAPLSAAVVPVWDGSMGILPGRAAIVAKLGTGELRVDFAPQPAEAGAPAAQAGSRSFYVDGGFAQMVENTLTILATKAVPAESLNESEAQAEVAEAESRRVEEMPDAAGRERIRRERDRARHKLRLARQFRGRGI